MWEFVNQHLAAIAAFGALLGGVAALLQALGVGVAMGEMWKRWIRGEEAKTLGTDVTVEYEQTHDPYSADNLVVHNRGEEVAENVLVRFEEDYTSSNSPKVIDAWNEKLPAELQPHQDFQLPVSSTAGDDPPYDLKISWEDRRGPREKTQQVFK